MIGNRGEWSETDRDINESIWKAAIDGGLCTLGAGRWDWKKKERYAVMFLL